MTREKLVEEKRRLIRVQSAVLKASKSTGEPSLIELTDAVAQLTLTVSRLLEEHTE